MCLYPDSTVQMKIRALVCKCPSPGLWMFLPALFCCPQWELLFMLRGGEDQLPVCLPVCGSVCVITVLPAVSFLAEDDLYVIRCFLSRTACEVAGVWEGTVFCICHSLYYFFFFLCRNTHLLVLSQCKPCGTLNELQGEYTHWAVWLSGGCSVLYPYHV